MAAYTPGTYTGGPPQAAPPMPKMDPWGAVKDPNYLQNYATQANAWVQATKAPPLTPPTLGSPGLAAAENEEDKNQQHGSAANILAGGMYQSPPQLARNILLGN